MHDDKKKPRGKLPVISPPSLRTCRDYTLQTNLLTNPPPPPSSSSLDHSKTSGASSLQPTLQVSHHQLDLSSYGLSSNMASSPAQPKLVQTHQPLSSSSSGSSHAQPKIQTHPSLLSSSGTTYSDASRASYSQPEIVPLRSVPTILIPANLKLQVVGDEKQVSARLQQHNRIEEKEKQTREVVGKKWYDYRYYEEDELEEPNLIIEVKWIKHYSSEYKILLVGEGDFSFSAALALAFVSATNITATSLDSIEFLSTNYKNALSNINKLRSLGAKVIHDVDATKMANVFPFKCMRFDRVVYNFPLAGFFPDEAKEVEIWRHRMLVQQFFENAKKMIEMDGEIHITHKSNGFFKEWNLEFLASRVGFRLIEEVPFNFKDYPGYRTKYGFGGDKNFDCLPSKTYKFGLKNPKDKPTYRFMR